MTPLLGALDLRLQDAVARFRARLNEPAIDALRGLYVSDAEVDALLAAGNGWEPDASQWPDLSARLSHLARVFGLDATEQEVLMICLAPDLDRRYERIYGYLQDDLTQRRPGPDLVMRLMNHARSEHFRLVRPSGTLRRRGLLIGATEDLASQSSQFAAPLRVDDRIVEYLLGSDALDQNIASWAALREPEPPGVAWSVASTEYATELEWLAGLLGTELDWTLRGPIAYIGGREAGAGELVARAAAAASGQRLLELDAVRWVAGLDESVRSAPFHAVVREALLQEAVLAIYGCDALLDEQGETRAPMLQLRQAIAEYPRPVLLIGEGRWQPAAWAATRPSVSVSLDSLSATARARLWTAHLSAACPSGAADELGARYQFATDADMRAVVQGAEDRAAQLKAARVDLSDLLTVARAVCSPPLGNLARRLEPRYGWGDLVLPPDALLRLRELCARIHQRATVYETWGFDAAAPNGRGVTALFVGLPGTGKSMAAEVIAADLGYDLYRVDLSALVSKYIGETEKNLERIFKAAEHGEAVLLFDEADALFGKRSEARDAHDRYANVEVAYLLQRLETYTGVALLTSNLSGNLDEAFLRRLDAIVEFPLPDERERREIWDRCLPAGAPRDGDVDVDDLARAFQLAGGHIRNSAVTAAFLAATDGTPIGRRHLLHAVKREYQKLGKLVGAP